MSDAAALLQKREGPSRDGESTPELDVAPLVLSVDNLLFSDVDIPDRGLIPTSNFDATNEDSFFNPRGAGHVAPEMESPVGEADVTNPFGGVSASSTAEFNPFD
jgi:hypothetical protein